MNRRQRRAQEQAEKKMSKEEKKLSEKIFLFNSLPQTCSACKKEFDKSNKDMVCSWKVVVRGDDKKVNLFCPDCIAKTKEILDNE
tara:strand:+ start:196 stop:450 length:255 start_codon:yes stop_codon:yes gene_type:complete